MDLEENLNISNSWIPVRALRNAADIKDSLKKGYHRKTASSPSASPSKNSISVEVKANSPTTNTIQFNSLHSRYNTASLELYPVPFDFPESTEKKYINNITRLNEELQIMSNQLKQAHETIASLTKKLNDSNGQHAMHLQSLHERHEQKMRRNKQDMDNLVKEFNIKSPNLALEKIILEKNLEIEVQKRRFQEQVDEMNRRFDERLGYQDRVNREQIQMLKDQFLDVVVRMKNKFCKDIESLQAEFRLEVDRVQTSFDNLQQAPQEVQDLEDDFQIIEELSSHALSKRQFGESDLDLSLKHLINQINLENDGSISDILRN